MFLNQVRTLVAHLWENDGEPMSVTAQYLDSVNVPPPATLPALWAPVGLRYHALHHLLPGLALSCAGRGAPPHLGRARRGTRPIFAANHRGLSPLVGRLAASSWKRAASHYSSCRIRTNSPISRNSKNGAQAARNGG